MGWVRTLADQVEVLEDDIEKIDRELRRVPGNVVDWSAYYSRIDRLKRDRMRLAADLRRTREQLERERAA